MSSTGVPPLAAGFSPRRLCCRSSDARKPFDRPANSEAKSAAARVAKVGSNPQRLCGLVGPRENYGPGVPWAAKASQTPTPNRPALAREHRAPAEMRRLRVWAAPVSARSHTRLCADSRRFRPRAKARRAAAATHTYASKPRALRRWGNGWALTFSPARTGVRSRAVSVQESRRNG